LFFGYNPNFPFPTVTGRFRVGVVAVLLRSLWELAKAICVWVFVAIAVFAGCAILDYDRTIIRVMPLVNGVASKVLMLQRASSVQVRDGLYVSFHSNIRPEIRARVLDVIRDEDAKVAAIFGIEATSPILIFVVPNARPGKEPGTEVLGHYVPNSHRAWGAHSITVSLQGVLSEGAVAHELTHMYTDILNPTLNLFLSEGLAHFVQDTLDDPVRVVAGRLDSCSFVGDQHWVSGKPRSNSDSIASRSLGFVVVHYLHHVRGVPLRDIPILEEDELPTAAEINFQARFLHLQVARFRALASQDDSLAWDFIVNSYLLPKARGDVGLYDTLASSSEARQRFQNLIRMVVAYLRWEGRSDAEINQIPVENLLSLSGDAFRKVDEHLDDVALRYGRVLFDRGALGVFDEGLFRLVSDSYPDDPEGDLQRAIDEGWARVYASEKVPTRRGSLPPYDRKLLEEIQQVTGPPSPARHVLHEWLGIGILEDLRNDQ
jgi:hypothetical protein